MEQNGTTDGFPPLDLKTDYDLRKAYKGGWTYLNPVFKNQEVGKGIVLDVNSMYPSKMRDALLPYGEPVFFEGEYQYEERYPLYVQFIDCEFRIKDGYLPTIQIKGSMVYRENEYLTESTEITRLALTNIDLKLFLEHYEVEIHRYIGGYKFRGASGIFREYVDTFYAQKSQAKKDGNKGLEYHSKIYLNSLYGKYATNPRVRGKLPYLDENGVVKMRLTPESTRKAMYLPVGIFVTSYARETIIRGAQKCYDRFIYADTDSLHLIGTELPEDIKIDNYKLGAFKLESTFDSAKFLRQKTYMEHINEYWNMKCAGLPESLKKQITFEEFRYGLKVNGKLMPKHVKGGIVLTETTFVIKM